MTEIEYLIDKNGKQKAIVIPIEIWQKIMPTPTESLENLSESLEDYCLNKAMNQAKETPLMNQENALKFLAEE